jgi:hypothetical protein
MFDMKESFFLRKFLCRSDRFRFIRLNYPKFLQHRSASDLEEDNIIELYLFKLSFGNTDSKGKQNNGQHVD